MLNKKIFSILFAVGFCFPLFLPEICKGVPYSGSQITLPEELAGVDLGQIDPTTTTLILAEARLKQGLWQEAIQYAQFVISRESQNSKAHGILGTIYALGGQKKMAESELALLKGKGEKGFYVELIEAMLKAQEKKFKEAEQHLGLALQKEPGHPVAIYYSGSLNLAQNNLDKAEKAFKEVIASNPNFSPCSCWAGPNLLAKKEDPRGYSLLSKSHRERS